MTEAIIRRIVKSGLAKRPDIAPLHKQLVDGIVRFWKASKDLLRNSLIEVPPTVSTFAEAIGHPSVKDVPTFQHVLLALGLHVWAGKDLEGKPADEQVTAVKSALTKSFPQ